VESAELQADLFQRRHAEDAGHARLRLLQDLLFSCVLLDLRLRLRQLLGLFTVSRMRLPGPVHTFGDRLRRGDDVLGGQAERRRHFSGSVGEFALVSPHAFDPVAVIDPLDQDGAEFRQDGKRRPRPFERRCRAEPASGTGFGPSRIPIVYRLLGPRRVSFSPLRILTTLRDIGAETVEAGLRPRDRLGRGDQPVDPGVGIDQLADCLQRRRQPVRRCLGFLLGSTQIRFGCLCLCNRFECSGTALEPGL